MTRTMTTLMTMLAVVVLTGLGPLVQPALAGGTAGPVIGLWDGSSGYMETEFASATGAIEGLPPTPVAGLWDGSEGTSEPMVFASAQFPGDRGWLDQLVHEVLIARIIESKFEPYVGQLLAVRFALFRGDETAVYAGMNRFMDMLEMRENGIPAEAADQLFRECYELTPGKFHDVSRHLSKYHSVT